MEPRENELATLFPNIASYLRTGLSSLYLAARQLVPPAERERSARLDAQVALLDQNYYRLLHLVNNLSAAACFESDAPLPLQACDIVDLVGSICAKTADVTETQGLDLRFLTPVNQHVCGVNREWMERLVYELLSNAVKFTGPGGTITVELQFNSRDKTVVLSVADTGSGIPGDLLPTLFNRYLHQERRDPYPHGLGLGLPLCRRIAQRHGGAIVAQSRPGKGSKFIVSIPDRTEDVNIITVSDIPYDYTGGFNATLLALADSLPAKAFLLRNEE